MSGWGKAGVRLTDAEAGERRQRRAKARLRHESAEKAMLGKAYRKWAAGMVVPWRLTMALDSKGLWGPSVDRACGVEEPVVDMWEAGKLYPSWEQLCALAKLCGVTPEMLTRPTGGEIAPMETSMRFHVLDVEAEQARWANRVLTFSADALADARAMGVRG